MADTTDPTEISERTRKVAISEGADVYGSDGERWGRIEAVGAKYLTIVGGFLGRKQSYLPLALVAAGDADRVDLTVTAAEARAQALDEEPADEPIYAHSEPIPVEHMEAIGLPEPERADIGLGETAPVFKPAVA